MCGIMASLFLLLFFLFISLLVVMFFRLFFYLESTGWRVCVEASVSSDP